jgi:hypothetical protein
MNDNGSELTAKAREKDEQKRIKDLAKEAKTAERKAKSAAKRAEFEARVQARKDDKAAGLEAAGKEVFSSVLGGKFVKFYENGYVSVSAWGGGTPEKLIDVTANADVSKKTGLGRAVVGVATFGLNIGTTSNMRGDIYVSIVTDKNTHMIHVSPPSESAVKAARKIEATGKGLVSRISQTSSSGKEHESLTDMASQLAKLAELRDSGALTEEEFSNAKAKLLG